MEYPDYIVKQVKEHSASYQLEGFLSGQGPGNPKIMLVGEAPGETEIHNGIPFSGRAGKHLMEFLERIHVTREEVYITSAVRSRPYKWREKKERNGEKIQKKYNRTPNQGEILAHAPLLDYELEHIDPPVIVTLGNIALQRLVGKNHKITDVHGELLKQPVQQLKDSCCTEFVWTEKEYSIFPTFHPASIFYNRSLLELIYEDWEKLKRYVIKN
ncbi:TPA: uracil-DNA glycosylase [Bacillus toyonensis]|uniref:uracil-DNA glycosylase n=1 Tax=Bacillus cereus group TaxID=86661 RepID=UPI00028AEE37|nr:uracil-DNA glycosylase [Bacillus toyonensis]AFU12185.1 Uracil-DNA glycosylase superfamily [Bacillus thuringiensis MC28]OTW85879.1 uracil-DNA glycosylase [Bacillus thuringiensis serovar cameroun]OTX05726.1 uracil-DNA glycosylase [Bacillus thuringiensis serovar seoulensis]QPW49429.1 uracil-DNA glycosylase [Bacillus thuringiensis]MCA1043503.1 uracil-DNA glycosylase [Bacillus toyonensis]